MKPDAPPPAKAKRLHPAAILVWFLDDSKRFILGLIAIIIARGGNVVVITSAAVLFLAAFEAVRYSRFTYHFEGNTLIVQGGLLNRFRRSLPFARVQSVDVVQKLRHRVFGVVELRIETAGGSSTEAPLVALLGDEAEELRALLLDEDASAPSPPAEPLVVLTLGDLIVAALTGGRVAVVAVIFGYAQEVFGDDLLESLAGRATDALRSAVAVTVLAALGVVALVLIVSVIATTVVYWNFTVRRQGARLIVERGLLDRRRASVPLKRVQAVHVRENPLRRIFGRAALSSVTAGYSPSKEEGEETSMLLPIGSREQALWLAGLALDLPAPPDRPLQRAPRGALWSRSVEAGAFAAVLVTAARLLFGTEGLWVLLGLVPLAAMTWLSYRALGFRLDADYLAVQSGVLNRRTTIIPRANVQHLALTRGPLQRAFGLASLAIGVPKAKPQARDLQRTIAEGVMAELYGTS